MQIGQPHHFAPKMAPSSAVPSSSAAFSDQLHPLILRGSTPIPSIQPTQAASTMIAKSNCQNGQKTNKAQVVALCSRTPLPAKSSNFCHVTNGPKEAQTFVTPAEFFARQSLNASRIAGRINTRHRFQQQNALFEDLLLAEAERDAVQTTLTIRGTAAGRGTAKSAASEGGNGTRPNERRGSSDRYSAPALQSMGLSAAKGITYST